jgi:hypothetical protein
MLYLIKNAKTCNIIVKIPSDNLKEVYHMADVTKTEDAPKYNWKKIIVIAVVVILALNIFVSLVNSKYDTLKAEVDQLKAASASTAADPGKDIAKLKADLETVRKSVEELKAMTNTLAQTDYDLYKAKVDALSKLLNK